jgi:hypothetical protein
MMVGIERLCARMWMTNDGRMGIKNQRGLAPEIELDSFVERLEADIVRKVPEVLADAVKP